MRTPLRVGLRLSVKGLARSLARYPLFFGYHRLKPKGRSALVSSILQVWVRVCPVCTLKIREPSFARLAHVAVSYFQVI